jgi:hypothetical protein
VPFQVVPYTPSEASLASEASRASAASRAAMERASGLSDLTIRSARDKAAEALIAE